MNRMKRLQEQKLSKVGNKLICADSQSPIILSHVAVSLANSVWALHITVL